MSTFAGLVQIVRNKLGDNFKNSDALNGAISAATTTTFTVDDGEKFKVKDVIEIESEACLITECPRVASYINEGAALSATDTTLTAATSHGIVTNDVILID